MGRVCGLTEENDFFVYDVISIGSREIIRKKDCLEMILNHFVTASLFLNSRGEHWYSFLNTLQK